MKVERIEYFIPTKQKKENGEKLSDRDLMNIGYMAGRFGINLNNNPNELNIPIYSKNGVSFNINSCTCKCFEKNLKNSGITFQVIA